VFKTRYLHEIGCFATTLLASVERCSKPDICTKSPPLRHHAACQRGAVFKTRYLHEIGCFATTLLASVERCSRCWTQWLDDGSG